jgi:hypothetical protein
MLKISLRLAVLSAITAAIMPGLAHATPLQTSAQTAFSFGTAASPVLSVSDTTAGTSTVNSGAQLLGTKSLQKFDSSKGFLTGVQIGLSSTYTQINTIAGNGNPPRGTTATSTSGTGGGSVWITAPTNASTVPVAQSFDLTCTPGIGNKCAGQKSVGATDNLSVQSSNLAAYAGNAGDTVNIGMVGSTSANLGSLNYQNGTMTSALTWNGTLTAIYDYLEHAALNASGAVGDTLTLNFGDILLGDADLSKSFSLGNGAGDRVGLSLTSFAPVGSSSAEFTTDLSSFANLAAGSSKEFMAHFHPSSVGAVSNTYALTFTDYVPNGAYGTAKNYSLNLVLNGNVLAKPVDATGGEVPEPASLMLLALGAAALAGSRKRRA